MEKLPKHPSPKHEAILAYWQAADRPYKKRGMQFYFNVSAIFVIVFLILFFFSQYMLIGTLAALLFVVLVVATVPPKQVSYQVTSWGVRVAGELTRWEDLTVFWPAVQLGHAVLIIGAKKFPGQLVLVIDPEKAGEIETALAKHIEKIAPPPKTWFDRRSYDLIRLVNLGQK